MMNSSVSLRKLNKTSVFLSLRCAWTLRSTWSTLLVVGFWRVTAAWMTAGRQNLSSAGFTRFTVKLLAGVCSEKTRATQGQRTSSPALDTACFSTRFVSLVTTHKVWPAKKIFCTLTSNVLIDAFVDWAIWGGQYDQIIILIIMHYFNIYTKTLQFYFLYYLFC